MSFQPANFIRRLKVVIDAGNGCYSRIAPPLLRELGYDVVELFCEPDGRFPGRNPNPAVAANLRALCETVVATGADLGVAYDGDGDRVTFVEERGRVVESDRAIVIFARHLLASLPPDSTGLRDLSGLESGGASREVVYDLKCSRVVPEEVRRAGGVPIMERSGHAFIKTTLLRRKALLGGEISGHFFFGELGGDDGLYATLLMLQIVAEDGRGLAALADSVPRYPITPDIRLPCLPVEAQAIVEELAHAFAGEPGCQVSRLDGVRIAWPDGWALVRPSVTEPLLTLRFEAHTEARLAEIRALVATRSLRLEELIKVEYFTQAQAGGWGETLRGFARFADLLPGARVLDVGTGPGLLPRLLAEAGARLALGCDDSLDMLRRATELAAGDPSGLGSGRRYAVEDANPKGLEAGDPSGLGSGRRRAVEDANPKEPALSLSKGLAWIAADALRLPFAAGAFDAALATNLLFLLPDPAAGVLALARVVRPGGVVAFLNPSDAMSVSAAGTFATGRGLTGFDRFSFVNYGRLAEAHHRLSVAQWSALAEVAGLTDVRTETRVGGLVVFVRGRRDDVTR